MNERLLVLHAGFFLLFLLVSWLALFHYAAADGLCEHACMIRNGEDYAGYEYSGGDCYCYVRSVEGVVPPGVAGAAP